MLNRTNEKLNVVYFQRKPLEANFSLEFIFEDVRHRLSNLINSIKKECPYFSKGILDRLRNILFAYRNQGSVNHITGDVLYLTYFLQKKHTILTIPDCVFMNNPSRIRRTILWFFWLYLPVHRTRFITAISQSTKAEILKYVNCDPEKIKVIPVAISPRFQPNPKPFNGQDPNILHIGAAPNKNLDRLIEAVKDIPCCLNIVGKLKPYQIERLKELNIDYTNEWGLTDEQVYEKYQQCDMLAFVSTYEGFGMPIVEANAVERPVVTSQVASMPEVAGNAACLVDPYNVDSIRAGIQKVIKEEAYRNELVANGRINKLRFDADKIAFQYYDLYREIENTGTK